MSRDKGFTLVEIMVALALLGMAVGIMINAFNMKDATSANIATRVMNDMNSIEMAFNNYLSDKGEYPDCATNGLADTNFAPAYIFPPKPPTGFSYLLKKTTTQYYICGTIAVSGATDPDFLALKTNIPLHAPIGKFFYNTSACPFTANMADPAGAATVNFTYYFIR